jgi:Flp pilus assembly protein TadG
VPDRGSAAIEFALVVPLLMVVVLAMVEITVAARVQLDLGHAAREGARQAATTPDVEAAVGAVRRALGDSGPRARVVVQRQHHVGGTARVVVELEHRLAAPLLGGVPIRLRASAVMRVER